MVTPGVSLPSTSAPGGLGTSRDCSIAISRPFSHVTAGRDWEMSHSQKRKQGLREPHWLSRGRAGSRPGASHGWLKRATDRFLGSCFNYKGSVVRGLGEKKKKDNQKRKKEKKKNPTTKNKRNQSCRRSKCASRVTRPGTAPSGQCQLWWPLPRGLFPDLLDDDAPLQTRPATPACSACSVFHGPAPVQQAPAPAACSSPAAPRTGALPVGRLPGPGT